MSLLSPSKDDIAKYNEVTQNMLIFTREV